MKVPDKLRVVEFQYLSWEGVWSYRFPVRHIPDYPHHVIHGWFNSKRWCQRPFWEWDGDGQVKFGRLLVQEGLEEPPSPFTNVDLVP